jgi:hypothetical protein
MLIKLLIFSLVEHHQNTPKLQFSFSFSHSVHFFFLFKKQFWFFFYIFSEREITFYLLTFLLYDMIFSTLSFVTFLLYLFHPRCCCCNIYTKTNLFSLVSDRRMKKINMEGKKIYNIAKMKLLFSSHLNPKHSTKFTLFFASSSPLNFI